MVYTHWVIFQWLYFTLYTGVVEKDINMSEQLLRFLRIGLNLVFITYIGFEDMQII